MTKDIKVLDCFGDICPLPVIKVEKQLREMNKGESFMLITDHSCVKESIIDKYPDAIIVEPMNGVWEITFIKK